MPSNPFNRGVLPHLPALAGADGVSIDRPKQVRPGVRYAQRDFPGNGRFSVPSPADAAARGGEVQDYESMGRVAETRCAKNLKGGR